VRNGSLWAQLAGLGETAVVDHVEFDETAEAVVVLARPRRRFRSRCSFCSRRCPGYDQGEGRRRWRSLDAGALKTYVEADAPRVRCPDHGVVVASVPWARHGAGHTRAFDDLVAWLATNTSKLAVCQLLRIAWRTVGAICARVVADAREAADPLDGLRRIGIDEISYRRGFKFLTVVVDHDTGRLVWAAPGRAAGIEAFFAALGPDRCDQIEVVSADAAGWIATAVAEHCAFAVVCLDPFHVVRWATRALDEVRKQTWRKARREGRRQVATESQRSRFVLWKSPTDLSERQAASLARIAQTNEPLYRAYLLKEELRLIFKIRGPEAVDLLDQWLAWARRCRIDPFVKLAGVVAEHREAIVATLEHGVSNGLIESVNTRVRLLTRIAFGFRSPEALIALAMLKTGGYCPALPGRAA
jgi:transposase